MAVGLGLEQHRRRMDPTTNEPLFTNCTRDFIGTLDYIFYSGNIHDTIFFSSILYLDSLLNSFDIFILVFNAPFLSRIRNCSQDFFFAS